MYKGDNTMLVLRLLWNIFMIKIWRSW